MRQRYENLGHRLRNEFFLSSMMGITDGGELIRAMGVLIDSIRTSA